MNWLIHIFITLFGLSVFAQEKLGVLSVEEVLLRPYFLLQEPQSGEFFLGDSSVAFGWKKSHTLGAIFRIGSQTLLNSSARFSDTVDDRLGVIEAFGQVTGDDGRLRVGLVPLEYGVEGGWLESELTLHRSLFFQRRVIALRDFGLSYQVGHQGFYSQMAVDNCKSGGNTYGRMFLTANWGWSNYRNLNLGVAAQTGTTKPESTSTSNDTFAGVDPTQEAKWRLANLFFHWYPNNWQVLLEVHLGELEQNKVATKLSGGHFDLGYRLNPYSQLLLRYDHFDPNEKSYGDLEREVSLGFGVSDKHNTNSLYVIATKAIEQGQEVNNDQLRLIWRLTSLSQRH